MAPPPPDPEKEARDEAHLRLLHQLDINNIPKPFRSSTWRPNQRRNKNIKTIVGDATRKEASSLMPTVDNSGAATPYTEDTEMSTDGESTPAASNSQLPNLAQASRNLSKLVLEKNLKAGNGGGIGGAPTASYMNIESAPSLAISRRYCDITGLKAPYTDPKTRLRYHDKEVFGVIRGLGQGVAEQYLEARGAHTILK